MKRQVTIVMYHYVRDLEHSRFPAIKGLTVDRFRNQLEYVRTHFTPIALEDILEAASDPKRELPPNSVLLTFDDGYSDHFSNVFPLLDARGIKGCFFPPAQAILEHKVLDVNKIQFVLAAKPNSGALLDQVFSFIDEYRSMHNLATKEAYLSAISRDHRYDTREVTRIKQLLQRELPEAVRCEIVRRLFEEHVSSDEVAFACELYMSTDQLACLHRNGMHIGSHGYSHLWLDGVSQGVQAFEVDRSLEFLHNLGAMKEDWTMCYPYGGFNDSLLQVIRSRKCRLGFTVEARIADLNADNLLTLPRIDTNDLPS